MSKETVYKNKEGKIFRIMSFPKKENGEACVVYQSIEDGEAYVMPQKDFFDGRMEIYRRPLPSMRMRVPNAALDNAMHEYWFHASQGEDTLYEYPEDVQKEVRELVECILNRACEGGLVLVDL